jgi:predicted  nucleic acid-binding Zn-ribbon protein
MELSVNHPSEGRNEDVDVLTVWSQSSDKTVDSLLSNFASDVNKFSLPQAQRLLRPNLLIALNQLKAKLQLKEEELEKYKMTKGDVERLEKRNEQLEKELETANGKIDDLEEELATANAKIAELEEKLETANGKIAFLEKELATANSKIAQLTTALDAANRAIIELRADTDNRFSAMEAFFESLKSGAAAGEAYAQYSRALNK